MRSIIKASAAAVLILFAAAFQVRRERLDVPRGPGEELASNLRRSLADDALVNQDIESLFARLQDPAFAGRLTGELRSGNAQGAAMLVQSTAKTSVEVEIGRGGQQCNRPPQAGAQLQMVGGRFCWYTSNGIRKCLWYSDKC